MGYNAERSCIFDYGRVYKDEASNFLLRPQESWARGIKKFRFPNPKVDPKPPLTLFQIFQMKTIIIQS